MLLTSRVKAIPIANRQSLAILKLAPIAVDERGSSFRLETSYV